MTNWFFFSLLCLISWGLWGFLSKLATNHLDFRSIFIYSVSGSMIVGLLTFLFGNTPGVHPRGTSLGILAGMLGSLGAIFFFSALSKGKASIVVTMTALYPIITILLSSIILREQITLKQSMGMLFAILAIILLSL